jgi:hypothetical protein
MVFLPGQSDRDREKPTLIRKTNWGKSITLNIFYWQARKIMGIIDVLWKKETPQPIIVGFDSAGLKPECLYCQILLIKGI